MGYTHYWWRAKTIPAAKYSQIVFDFNLIVPALERQGVKLAGGLGTGEPNLSQICFNGMKNCGHPVNHHIAIAWASPKAQGVGSNVADVAGGWFAGRLLTKRCCDGDCSHETFYFPRVLPKEYRPIGKIAYRDREGKLVYNKPEKVGKYFNFCKTAFKPYDWAVTTFLIIAKHHLGDTILVSSDGTSDNWQDARLICQLDLGYGIEFKLDQ